MLGQKIVVELSTGFCRSRYCVLPPSRRRIPSMPHPTEYPVDVFETCIAPAFEAGNAALVDEETGPELLLGEARNLPCGSYQRGCVRHACTTLSRYRIECSRAIFSSHPASFDPKMSTARNASRKGASLELAHRVRCTGPQLGASAAQTGDA